MEAGCPGGAQRRGGGMESWPTKKCVGMWHGRMTNRQEVQEHLAVSLCSNI